MYVCMYVCAYECMYVCICTYIYVPTYNWDVSRLTHTHTHTQTHTLHSGYINGRIDRGTIAKRHTRRNITRFFKDYLKQKYRCVVSLDSQRGTAASRCNWSWIKFLFPWILIIRFILFMPCPVSFWSELKEILPCILRSNVSFYFHAPIHWINQLRD